MSRGNRYRARLTYSIIYAEMMDDNRKILDRAQCVENGNVSCVLYESECYRCALTLHDERNKQSYGIIGCLDLFAKAHSLLKLISHYISPRLKLLRSALSSLRRAIRTALRAFSNARPEKLPTARDK